MDKLAVAAGVALALALETILACTVWVWLKVGPSPPSTPLGSLTPPHAPLAALTPPYGCRWARAWPVHPLSRPYTPLWLQVGPEFGQFTLAYELLLLLGFTPLLVYVQACTCICTCTCTCTCTTCSCTFASACPSARVCVRACLRHFGWPRLYPLHLPPTRYTPSRLMTAVTRSGLWMGTVARDLERNSRGGGGNMHMLCSFPCSISLSMSHVACRMSMSVCGLSPVVRGACPCRV